MTPIDGTVGMSVTIPEGVTLLVMMALCIVAMWCQARNNKDELQRKDDEIDRLKGVVHEAIMMMCNRKAVEAQELLLRECYFGPQTSKNPADIDRSAG